jgi:hypothetical protein
MLGPARIIGGKEIGELFSALRETALDDGGEIEAFIHRDEGMGERCQTKGYGGNFGGRMEDRTRKRALQFDAVTGLNQDRECAIDLAAGGAGEALANLFLHDEEERRGRSGKAQAFHEERSGDIIGKVSADGRGGKAEIGKKLKRVPFPQLEAALGDLGGEAFAKEGAKTAVFFQGDETDVFRQQAGGERPEARTYFHDAGAGRQAGNSPFSQPRGEIAVVKEILAKLLERAEAASFERRTDFGQGHEP